MKVPLSWIKEFVDLKIGPEEIEKELTRMGLEVDQIEEISPPFEGVVVAKVLKTSKHPNADKLQKALVSDGTNEYEVVCGAPNCREGLITAFAKVGATLKSPDVFVIKAATIRGEPSFGMLCSEKELGLSQEGEGILELDEGYPLGSDLASLFKDTVFELSLTPNLGHCLSVLGIARELASATHKPLKRKEVRADRPNLSFPCSIASDFCSRYSAFVIKGVKVAPSPLWIRRRLELSQIRPINNIVDITNYVMLETGQPLHAFDLSQIDQIVVRQANEEESFVTLDGKTRVLTPENLVIASGQEVIALAGIMGGESSQITQKTTDILLESAIFDRVSLRKTAKRFGLMSEASKRFEKGVDHEASLLPLFQAGHLVESLASGKIVEFTDLLKETPQKKVVNLRLSALNKLLKTTFSKERVEEFLTRLFLKYNTVQESFHVEIPSFRQDISGEADLIEDIAKLYGYEKFKGNLFSFTPSSLPSTPLFLFEREVRAHFVGQGLQEFLNCDLIGPKLMQQTEEALMPFEESVVVKNPVSLEQSVLRTSLLPSLLNVIKHNVDRGSTEIQGFEIGRIHFKNDKEYFEQSQLGIVLSGSFDLDHFLVKERLVDFYDLKGVLESFFNINFSKQLEVHSSSLKAFHPGRQAALFIKGVEVGAFGEVHPKILRRFDLNQRVYYAEINLNDLLKLRDPEEKMREIPSFPGSDRDLTLSVLKTLPFDTLFKEIELVNSPLLEKVTLKSVYTNPSLGEKHNVTLRFLYRDKKKTVLQEDVEREHQKIVTQLKRFG
jgi:phenylalanyl-tRNA synthetase beta chain